jgi:N-methylhydantoinase B
MALTLARSSRSTIVRVALDFSTGVLGPSGELLAQGLCQPIHLGGMPPALAACLEHYQERIYPGDVLINNDPYEGGSHLPDVFLYKPVFLNGVCLSYLCAMTHYPDMGGRIAGSSACDSTEIYQEGLRIPPLKLFEEGKPNEAIFRILEKAVRVPELVLGDLQANLAALRYGERELMGLVSMYGVEELQDQIEGLLAYTEEATRAAIRSLPDGAWQFTDYVSDDSIEIKPIPIVVNLTKSGDSLSFDFTGTGPQAKGAINPPFVTTKALVYAAVKSALGTLGHDIPNTGGYFRPIEITAGLGSFANPLPPAAVTARNVGGIRIFQAVLGAFAQMLPDRIPACTGGCENHHNWFGYDKSQLPWKAWVSGELHNEVAGGAFPDRNGFDAQGCGSTNVANIPIEQLEAEYPLRVERYGILADREGAGKYRGGVGMVRTYRLLADDVLLQMRTDRRTYPPYGLQGGQASAPSQILLNPGTPEEELLPTKFVRTLSKGDVLELRYPGGGGWGDPLEHDSQQVIEDVLAEKITLERAREVYGVVVDQGGRGADVPATVQLRRSLGRPQKT